MNKTEHRRGNGRALQVIRSAMKNTASRAFIDAVISRYRRSRWSLQKMHSMLKG